MTSGQILARRCASHGAPLSRWGQRQDSRPLGGGAGGRARAAAPRPRERELLVQIVIGGAVRPQEPHGQDPGRLDSAPARSCIGAEEPGAPVRPWCTLTASPPRPHAPLRLLDARRSILAQSDRITIWARPLLPREQLVAIGDRDRLRTAAHAELREDVLEVRADGLLADEELLRDVVRGEPRRQQPEHLALARR